jgi:hypothetical protein
MIGFETAATVATRGRMSWLVVALLASMLASLASPALASPAAEGRIGLSLEIPPRVSVDTRQRDKPFICVNEEAGPGRLRVVDAEGRGLPRCDARSGVTRQGDDPLRRVMVVPV